ncbi:hypothetical protein SAMN03159488_01495 [Pseudomonas sp. NFIX10]|nr:hypothetical protein SAMN03159488_01495 [Pseudomonas sp. NFIX10]SFE56738.1 hypothetical protein SAMN03159367_01495 [Pseudomonas sp. NFACC06-1]
MHRHDRQAGAHTQIGSGLAQLRVTVPAADGQSETVTDYKYDAVRKVYELISQ